MFVQEDYPKYTSFLTVRHPFERLVSAYEHKVLRNHAKYLHNATFEEFIRKFVIKEAQKCPHYNHCMNLHWMPYIRYMTFISSHNKCHPDSSRPQFLQLLQHPIQIHSEDGDI